MDKLFELSEFLKSTQELNQKIDLLSKNLNLDNPCTEIRRHWIPRNEVMKFLGYADTQISAITKKYKIATSEIGKRKFYSTASLLEILEKNKK